MAHPKVHKDFHQNPDIQVDVRGTVDSKRSPQLDKVKSRDRCGCACASSRDSGCCCSDGGGGSSNMIYQEDTIMLPAAFIAEVGDAEYASDDNASVRGHEGIEEHSIEIGDLGMERPRDIRNALARHNRHTCHSSATGFEREYYGSPSDSMMVEANSDSDMRCSILSSLSSRSRLTRNSSTSALVAHVGTGDGQDFQLPLPALPNFIGEPIWLSHELDHCSNMIIGALRYPVELSMTGESVVSDFPEFDLW